MFHLSPDSLRHFVGQPVQAGGVGASGPYSGHVWEEVAVSVRAAPVDHPAWSHGRPGEEEGDGREAGARGWGCPRRWGTGAMEPGIPRPWTLVGAEAAGINTTGDRSQKGSNDGPGRQYSL